jgi:poly(A) polymerase
MIDPKGNTRFFGHEKVGAQMTQSILRDLRLPQREIDSVVVLVQNHMRLGNTGGFTATAARRLVRDLDGDLERLLALVEADSAAHRPGFSKANLAPIREMIEKVQSATPAQVLVSPLNGREIMDLTGLGPGAKVGQIKSLLTEWVLEGKIEHGDKAGAIVVLQERLSEANREDWDENSDSKFRQKLEKSQ